jgi:hypothetical protein
MKIIALALIAWLELLINPYWKANPTAFWKSLQPAYVLSPSPWEQKKRLKYRKLSDLEWDSLWPYGFR